MNLASLNDSVYDKTLSFFKRGVKLSADCKSRFYSIHGGYGTDPFEKDSHGFVFPLPKPENFNRALLRFVEGMISLSRYAREYGVRVLIENNVLAEHNKYRLLLATPDDFKEFFDLWPNDLPPGGFFGLGPLRVRLTRWAPFRRIH